MNRRHALALMASAPFFGAASARAGVPDDVLGTWYRLALTLTRHTPIYSPPVASRTFAYLGVASYEVVASGTKNARAISSVVRPPTARNVNATCEDDDSLGWQHMK